jgi:L-arabinose isomerase
MLHLLTGQPTHNTDWLEPLEDDSVVFTHCGSSSFALAERQPDITLASVRLMGRGVCALFPSKTGPVTLIGLVAHRAGYQLALLEGEAVSADMVFPGNPLRVRFPRPAEELIEWIHEQGIGHHWMAGHGHVGKEIRAWASIVGPELRLVEMVA